MEIEQLRESVRKYRMVKKITQANLAKLLKVSQATINAWEAGKSKPSGIVLDKLMQLLKGKKSGIDSNEISLFKRICENFSVDEILILGKVIERFR